MDTAQTSFDDYHHSQRPAIGVNQTDAGILQIVDRDDVVDATGTRGRAIFVDYTMPLDRDWLSFSPAANKNPSSNTMPDAVSANWARYTTAGISLDTYLKLVTLGQKPDGWRGNGSKKLSDGSISTFLEFWGSVRDFASDAFLTLAPSGNLFAEWHKSWKSHLDIEFVEGGVAFFGLFSGSSIVEGKVDVGELAGLLRAHKRKPLSWRQK